MFEAEWIAESVSSDAATRMRSVHGSVEVRNAVAYIRRIHAVSGEGGHNATFRAACKLRESGLTRDQAIDCLADWNETNASPPWTAKELAHKVEDAFRHS